LTLLVGSSDP